MLPSQLYPYQLIYLDQKGKEFPTPTVSTASFQTFEALVDHVRTHPNFTLAEHTLMGVGFEQLVGSDTELVGAVWYRRTSNDKIFRCSMFKVKGPLPNLSSTGWYLDFTS
jgi:hypothetical protein